MAIAAELVIAPPPGRVRAIVAAVAGNLIEWYDFTVYSFVAVIIGRHFFPSENAELSLLTTYAVFGIGFVARPLGGILIGRLGDRAGRRTALVVGMGLMTFGTTLIGLLPDYGRIGVAAPLLVLFARLCQGFAIGGEWGNSAAFLVEWAPGGRRGFFGSFQSCSTTAGTLIGSGITALLFTLLGTPAMNEWGWRIPFLISGVLSAFILVMRRTMAEPPVYHAAATEASAAEPVTSNAVRTLRAVGVILPFTVGTYVYLNYLPTFIITQVKMSSSDTLWSSTVAALVSALCGPLFGALSDRIGRKPQLLATGLLLVVLPVPLFLLLLSRPGFAVVLAVQTVLYCSQALVGSISAATLSELFPTRIRTTWMTAVYAITVSLFGGFAPFIVTALIAATGKPIAPVAYIMTAGAVSLAIISGYRETAFRRLE